MKTSLGVLMTGYLFSRYYSKMFMLTGIAAHKGVFLKRQRGLSIETIMAIGTHQIVKLGMGMKLIAPIARLPMRSLGYIEPI